MPELYSREDIIKASALLTDSKFLQQFVPILNPDHFRQPELRWLTHTVIKYVREYKVAPTFNVLRSLLHGNTSLKTEDKEILQAYIEEMQDYKPKRTEAQYYARIFEKFIQQQYVSYIVRDVTSLSADGRIEESENVLREFRMPKAADLDVIFAPKDYEILLQEDQGVYVPTGIPGLDELIKGLKPGEEGVIIAPTGYGKSQALVHIGAHAWRLGYNVVHFSFENSKEETMARYLANMGKLNVGGIKQDQSALQKVLLQAENTGSSIAISRLIGRHTDVNTLLSDLYSILDVYDFEPDLLLVDYGDLMRPTVYGKNRYEDMQTVFAELRDLAAEVNLPLWTATQTNREGLKAKRVKLDHVSESFGKAMTADLIVSLSRPDKDEALDSGEDGEITGDIAEFRVLKLRRGAEGREAAKARTNFAYARFDPVESFEEHIDLLGERIVRKRNGY